MLAILAACLLSLTGDQVCKLVDHNWTQSGFRMAILLLTICLIVLGLYIWISDLSPWDTLMQRCIGVLSIFENDVVDSAPKSKARVGLVAQCGVGRVGGPLYIQWRSVTPNPRMDIRPDRCLSRKAVDERTPTHVWVRDEKSIRDRVPRHLRVKWANTFLRQTGFWPILLPDGDSIVGFLIAANDAEADIGLMAAVEDQKLEKHVEAVARIMREL